MSREGLKIDTGLVQTTRGRIEAQNLELYNTLNRIKGYMARTSEEWKSPAADELRENFEEAADKFFSDYKEVIQNYTEFLRVTVVESYEQLDNKLKLNAQRFTTV